MGHGHSKNNDDVGDFFDKITDTSKSSSIGNRINKNSNNRRLKSSSNYATSNDSGPSDTFQFWPDEALTLKQMAGTFLIHLILSVLSILIGIFSRLAENRRNKKGGRHQEQQEEALSEQDLSGTSL